MEEPFGYTDGVYPTKDIEKIMIDKYTPIIESLRDVFYNRWSLDAFDQELTKLKNGELNSINTFLSRFRREKEYLTRSGRRSTKEQRLAVPSNIKRIDGFLSRVIQDYQKYNYTSKYFIFLDTSKYLYQLWSDRTEVTPEMYETGVTQEDVSSTVLDNLLEHGLGFRGYRLTSQMWEFFRNKPIGNKFLGWNKQSLVSALMKSELFYEEIIPVTENISYWVKNEDYGGEEGEEEWIPINETLIRYHHRFPNLLKLGMKPDPKVYVYVGDQLNQNGQRQEEAEVPANYSRRGIPGYYLKILPKYILEQFYILAYSPRFTFDRKMVCSIPKMDTFVLRRLIQKYFRVSRERLIEYRTKDEMCSFLDRLQLMSNIVTPEVSEALIFQPGSQALKNYMTYPGLFLEPRVEAPPMAYFQFYDRCNDANVDKSQIIFDAIELGLIDKINRNMSKEQICEIIKQFIRPLIK